MAAAGVFLGFRVRAVQDDEFARVLWVIGGKRPRDNGAPVVSNNIAALNTECLLQGADIRSKITGGPAGSPISS